MKKEIRKIAGMPGISFTKEEKRIYGMDEGDILDLKDMVVIKKKWAYNSKVSSEIEEHPEQEQASENISDIMAKQKQEQTNNKIQEMIK